MSVDLVPQLVLNGLVLGSSYAVIGLAMALILGVTGRFHFAFAFTYTLSAFVAAVAAADHGVPPVLALLVGVCAGGVAGLLIEVVVYRRLSRLAAGAALMPVFVSSLGIAIAGQNLIQLLWARDATSISFPLMALERIDLPGDLTITRLDLVVLVVMTLLAVGGVAVLRWSRAGQVVRAVQGNPEMARVVGIRPERVYAVVFLVASAAGGLVAALNAARLAATPPMGQEAMFTAFVVAFLAGTRAPALRVVLVGFGLGVVQAVSGLWVPSNLTNLVVFALLFGYLVLRAVSTSVRVGPAGATAGAR